MTRWFSVAALALLLVGASRVQAEPEKKPLKESASFSLLRTPAAETARGQAQDG